MTKYNIFIDSDDETTQSQHIEQAFDYEMLPDRVFYVAGSDSWQWICLKPGQRVTVTEYEE